MFKLGQIISCEDVRKYIKSLADIDEEILEMYTKIFSNYICTKVLLSDLDYSWIDEEEEEDLIEEYAENIANMPPIVTSPSFQGKRIVYDGCHRCKALEWNERNEVIALVPYKTIDGRFVENMETSIPELHDCKYGECDRGKCCLSCEHNKECGDICSYCFELGTTYKIVSKNVSLFCDGVWE